MRDNSHKNSIDSSFDQSFISAEEDFNTLNPKNTIEINNKRINYYLKHY